MKLRDAFRYVIWGIRKLPFLMTVYIVLFAVNAVIPSVIVVLFSGFVDRAIDCFKLNLSVSRVVLHLGLIAGCMVLSAVIVAVAKLVGIRVHNQLEISVLSEVNNKLENLSYSTLENEETQALLQRIGKEPVENFFNGINNSLKIISHLIEVVAFAAVIIGYSWYVGAGIVLIAIPVLRQAYKSGVYEYQVFEEAQENKRKIEYYESVLTSRPYSAERKLFSFSPFIAEKWSAEYNKYVELNEEGLKKISKNVGITGTATNLVPLLFGLFLLVPLSRGSISGGVFVSLLATSFALIKKITVELYWSISDFAQYHEFYADYVSFLNLSSNRPRPTDRPAASARRVVKNKRVSDFSVIEMRNVSFRYPGSDRKVLDNLNLKFEKGERYALVGENGSGKTTIVKLLLGLYDNYEGEILIDGVDLREIYSVSDLFSVAFQDFHKYEIRLRDFLSFGRDRFDLDRAIGVLDTLGIDSEILKQNPYLGRVDRSSLELSEGQWQKLLLARILLDDSPFKILDEPTASIDPLQEARLYNYFDSIPGDFTCLLITHRLGGVINVKNILVLADGKIVEKGSHDELMKKGGRYAMMFNAQRRWYSEKEGW
ncbi:MAG TPA: ABC transporter ATP-binding protein [Firmicutes bacterium]|nr:ABC transporter ATP-binding protein [Candidatus Fermentithermobacillaceae bacterium]